MPFIGTNPTVDSVTPYYQNRALSHRSINNYFKLCRILEVNQQWPDAVFNLCSVFTKFSLFIHSKCQRNTVNVLGFFCHFLKRNFHFFFKDRFKNIVFSGASLKSTRVWWLPALQVPTLKVMLYKQSTLLFTDFFFN